MKVPHAVIIAIGDEMTSGARLDTNTQWLCQRLGELGILVRATLMVGDQLSDNVDVFRFAIEHADIVLSTGGLGPTADDLTRDALAAATGKSLILHEPSLRHIESLFQLRGREMPPRNRVQAMLPAGAQDIFNPQGTAPGVDMIVDRHGGGTCRVFALPGVPAEMKQLFLDTVSSRITESCGLSQTVIRHAVIKCFGLGESEMEARLGEMISRQSSPRVGITVSAATISLRITACSDNERECFRQIDHTRQEILHRVGEFVFGEGEAFELQHAVAEILLQRRQKVETIEMGYAGLLADWFAGLPDPRCYAGGQVQNSTDTADEDWLGETTDTADWRVIVDRYPALETTVTATPEVRVSILGRNKAQFTQNTFRLGGHPTIIHPRIAKATLAFFLKHLLDQDPHPA